MKQYKNLIFAGTFDHLHIGHKKMLDRAFSIAKKVSIGITTKKLYQTKPLANLIPTYEVRRRAVERYLQERNWLKRAKFSKLDDIYGPSINPNSFDSILVTKETEKNGKKVNLERQKRGLPPLELVVVPFVLADDGKPVTSKRIRMGEIDSEGHNFQFSIFNFPSFATSFVKTSAVKKASRGKQKKQLILPEDLREELRKPLGKVITGSVDQQSDTAKKILQYVNKLKSTMVIAVGDIVTSALLEIDFIPDLMIIDYRSRRTSLDNISNIKNQISKLQIKNKKELINTAGTINLQAAEIIRKSFKSFLSTRKKQLIIVKGEEDLLALPAILLAPLHSIVLYGQWNLGVVMVEVTEEMKKKIEGIIKKFS